MRADGFCDAEDGACFAFVFMPTQPGGTRIRSKFTVRVGRAAHWILCAHTSNRKGPVRVDKEHPWHFIVEGTGEHYFWNSTTTYWLLGWRDDAIIRESVDRLAKLKVKSHSRRAERAHS